VFVFFFFNDTATTEIYTLSLHDRSSDLLENIFLFRFRFLVVKYELTYLLFLYNYYIITLKFIQFIFGQLSYNIIIHQCTFVAAD